MKLGASELFERIHGTDSKIIICRGGTRSGKSMSIALCALIWLLDSHEHGHWSICRKTLPALRATAYRDFHWLVNEMNVGSLLNHNRTELSYAYRDRVVEFFALDDERKIRSRKRRHLHLVEANELDFETFTQMALRTTGRIYLDFNPDDINHWINTELEQQRATTKKDVKVIVSTYRDNPFLTADEIAEIEYLKTVDEELWQIFGEGNYGKLSGLIFRDYELIDELPDGIEYNIGLDFGFARDPNGIVRIGKHNNRLYIDEVLYRNHLINSDLADTLENYKDELIVADSAEPKSIEDLRRRGFRVLPSVKGSDSIRSGLARMQEFKLHITKRSTNLIKELNHYKLQENGKPIDAMNHLIDAARYVVQTLHKVNNEMGTSHKISAYKNIGEERVHTERIQKF